MERLWIHTVCLVALTLFLPMDVQAQEARSIKADFVRVMTLASTGEEVLIEEGTYFLSPDGRYRIDKTTSQGNRNSEIWLPEKGERIALNHDTRTGVRVFYNRRLSAQLGEPPQGFGASAQPTSPGENLGRRTVGPLTLIGFAAHTPIPGGDTVLNEWWVWAPPGAPPQLIEMKSTSPDGRVDDRRVTAASLATLSDDLYSVPSTYDIQEVR